MSPHFGGRERFSGSYRIRNYSFSLVVDPLSLAPYTPFYFTPYLLPTFSSSLPAYSLIQKGEKIFIEKPGGKEEISPEDLPQRWLFVFGEIFLHSLAKGVLQGGFVERDGKGIVFLGRSGTGKTTLTYFLHKEGFIFRSDEYLHLRWKGIVSYPRPLEVGDHTPPSSGKIFKDETLFFYYPEAVEPEKIVPWEKIVFIFVLEKDRVGPALLPFEGPWAPLFHLPPGIHQFFSLLSLLKKRVYRLYPGGIEETVRYIVKTVERRGG